MKTAINIMAQYLLVMVTEEQIKEIIEQTIHAKYIGKMNIKQEDGFYILQLFFQQNERPRISIAIETDDDACFLDYVRDEMKTRGMNMVKF